MKTFLSFWAATVVVLTGLLFWRNKGKYRGHSGTWLMTKTVSEMGLLILTALRMPFLLAAWISLSVTRPIQTPWLKTTMSVLLGVGLSWLMLVSMEVVLLVSVFCIDDITGEDRGLLYNWNVAKRAESVRQAQAA